MAAKKTKKSGSKPEDRQYMDASGAPDAGYMGEQAEEDLLDAVTKELNKGLKDVAELATSIAASHKHGKTTDDDDLKIACLEECAKLGSAIKARASSAIKKAGNTVVK